MRNDTVGEIKKILDFLKIPYLDEDLKDKLRRDYRTFKRLVSSYRLECMQYLFIVARYIVLHIITM